MGKDLEKMRESPETRQKETEREQVIRETKKDLSDLKKDVEKGGK